MQKLWKPLCFLFLIILFCSVIVRVLSGQETLSDYAQKNPEIAYATPKKQPARSPQASSIPDVLKTPIPEVSPTPTLTPTPAPAVTPGKQLHAVNYAEGFFYHDLTDEIITAITGISYPISEETALAISYDDLCYMNVLHYDFNGEVQMGELICNKKIAQDLIEIFHELYLNEYQIERIKLIDEYNGDDTASMLDNNTSCFNYRVVDGTTSLSKHAMGCAIDINPFYNPYVVFNKDGTGETYISPEGSEIYADRSQNFPYKIDENDLCYKLFKKHGFVWGGDWNSCKDYQHFQKVVN